MNEDNEHENTHSNNKQLGENKDHSNSSINSAQMTTDNDNRIAAMVRSLQQIIDKEPNKKSTNKRKP